MNCFGKTWSEEEVKSILQIHTSKLRLTFFLSWAMTDGLSAVIFNEDTFQVIQNPRLPIVDMCGAP